MTSQDSPATSASPTTGHGARSQREAMLAGELYLAD
ncbi:sugar O-acetyltransferase, partial [Streptomyces sp. SID8455]|nr:sugar O-acetyltransferase [Streptomyces sp. SID8455]